MSYSQSTEEIVILSHFGNRVINLLSIGEHAGVQFSNAYALIQQGAYATLVEPVKKQFLLLQELHKFSRRVQVLPFAIGTKNEIATFYQSVEIDGKPDSTMVSTLKEEETARWIAGGYTFEEVQVTVITFERLMYLSNLKTFNFISIDTEGMELEILPQINFKELETEMLCVENNGKDQDKFNALILPWGFKLVHITPENLIYARDRK